ncbi:MAG TPA: AsmA-like C-terminal region-containing protein [Bryobacteraceae bacterium]|nr:AsmA-like C-terminal region-containing protein [Bryobacteraceae bacterium]
MTFAHFLRLLRIAGVVLLILFCGVLVLLVIRWPFTRSSTIQSFQHLLRSDVSFGEFHQCFWPEPGYDATNLTITRGSGKPLATVQAISTRSSWIAMLSITHRIKRSQLKGVRVDLPAHVPPPSEPAAHELIKTTATELRADGAILSIARPARSLKFTFSRLVLRNIASNKAILFDVALATSWPAAKIRAQGAFGPMRNPTQNTKASGSFALETLNLSQYRVVAGDISSVGSFRGTLRNLNVKGKANITQFQITDTGHSEDISSQFNTNVNGVNGDVDLLNVTFSFLHTALLGAGRIRPAEARPGKTVSLDVHSRQAQVNDLLYMFTHSPRPAMTGPITVHCHVVLPPGNLRFLRRVQLNGEFRIDKGLFTNSATEGKITKLSERSQGRHHPGDLQAVDAEISSDVDLKDGVARLSNALFAVPDATVSMNGTYNLINDAIDLKGKLAMKASLSSAAGGFKSMLLLPLDPLYKKGDAGTVLPIQITGVYPNPKIHVSLKP